MDFYEVTMLVWTGNYLITVVIMATSELTSRSGSARAMALVSDFAAFAPLIYGDVVDGALLRV